jgi:hypothetical protein
MAVSNANGDQLVVKSVISAVGLLPGAVITKTALTETALTQVRKGRHNP